MTHQEKLRERAMEMAIQCCAAFWDNYTAYERKDAIAYFTPAAILSLQKEAIATKRYHHKGWKRGNGGLPNYSEEEMTEVLINKGLISEPKTQEP